jgi:hypothetical protein
MKINFGKHARKDQPERESVSQPESKPSFQPEKKRPYDEVAQFADALNVNVEKMPEPVEMQKKKETQGLFNKAKSLNERMDEVDKKPQPAKTIKRSKLPVKEQKKIIKEQKKSGAKQRNKQYNDMASVQVKENKEGINWTRAGLYLSALAMIGIIFFSQMAGELNPSFILLIWLFGMLCFLPLGVILGWFFLDPYMRCKLMRRMRGRNYGIVNFLHKGGQRIVSKIKDLDDDVIVENGRMWILNREGIHYLNVDGQKILHKEIKTENIKTLPANVPCLFLDPETMNPITFLKTETQTNPQEAGSIVLGYINNQIMKNKLFKKTQTIFYILIIVIVIVNLVLSLQLYTWMEEIYNLLPVLRRQIQNLGQILAEQQPIQTILLNWWNYL